MSYKLLQNFFYRFRVNICPNQDHKKIIIPDFITQISSGKDPKQGPDRKTVESVQIAVL